MRKAIVVGATSGIGRALAVELARAGYAVGVTGRRVALLEELRQSLSTPVYPCAMDVSRPEEAIAALDALIAAMGGVDLLVISSGVGIPNPELLFASEQATIAVNVTGFVAMATAGYRYFAAQGGGHLVGITSVAALRGSRWNPAYGASKAFDASYLEGLRARAHFERLPLAVTDIRPGFVETAMTADNPRMFWVASPEAAARQIAAAIHRKARVAYITRRWTLIAWLIRHLPDWLLERI